MTSLLFIHNELSHELTRWGSWACSKVCSLLFGFGKDEYSMPFSRQICKVNIFLNCVYVDPVSVQNAW